MVETLRGISCTFNPDGTVYVQWQWNESIHEKNFPSIEALQYTVNAITDPAIAGAFVLASWLGVDPQAQDVSKFTEFVVEMDFTQLQPVKRVLPL